MVQRVAQRRIQKELEKMQECPIQNVEAAPVSDDNDFVWKAKITGSHGHEGADLYLQIVFPQEYPVKAPIVAFTSAVNHPNVNTDGQIDVEILKKEWEPGFTAPMILEEIKNLFSQQSAVMP